MTNFCTIFFSTDFGDAIFKLPVKVARELMHRRKNERIVGVAGGMTVMFMNYLIL